MAPETARQAGQAGLAEQVDQAEQVGQARVSTTTSGQPLRLEVAGRRYRVAADPVQWFERRPWWGEVARAPRGRCPHLVDREMWQLQVVPERPPAARRRAAVRAEQLRTLELERDRETGTWRLVNL